tara:strand:+ start:449 stop:748 length:300 start_codon:yes stop_codon:yes gene_type:complete
VSEQSKTIKVYDSYELACKADDFKTSDEYKLGLDSGIYAIFDNLSGYQCRDLVKTLIENNMGEHVPYHIIYRLAKESKVALDRKDITAYLHKVKEDNNE